MADWYYAQNEEQLGPVTAAALKEMATAGKLLRDDLIWREGMERWAPAHKVRGLFPTGEADDESIQRPNTNGKDNAYPPRAKPTSDVVPVDDIDDEDDSGSISGDDETAIDVLPLGGPEESKLHVPLLSAPDEVAAPPRSDSNEIVVFEPASATPPPPARKPRPDESDRPASDSNRAQDSTDRQTRIDVPPRDTAWQAGVGLFLQTFTWVSCLLVILLGGVVYLGALLMTADASKRLAASGIYLTFVVASYFLARATERVSRAYGQWFGVSREKTTRRGVRDRNWQRFQ